MSFASEQNIAISSKYNAEGNKCDMQNEMCMQCFCCGKSLIGSIGDVSDVIVIIFFTIEKKKKRCRTVNWPNETEWNQNR